MQTFREFVESSKKLNCEGLSEVTDITSQCNYDDEKSGDSRDKVSCCQDNGYNEMENKLKTYTTKYTHKSKEMILKAMCECCNEIKHQARTHESYDECIDKKLR